MWSAFQLQHLPCCRVWFKCEGWSNTTAVHFLVWTRWSRTQFTRSGCSCFHANSIPLDWNQDHIFKQTLARMVNPNLGTAHLCSHSLNELCGQAGVEWQNHCESHGCGGTCCSALYYSVYVFVYLWCYIRGVSDGEPPPGPSADLTQPPHLCRAAASTNTNSACGYKQGEAHQSTKQNHFKLTRSCSHPHLSQRLFFPPYFFFFVRLILQWCRPQPLKCNAGRDGAACGVEVLTAPSRSSIGFPNQK